MPRIAIVDLSFHWPPTGGSWVDVAHIASELADHGAAVRIVVPRVDTGGLRRGHITEAPPVEVEQVPVSLHQFTALALPRILESRVRAWRPDFVMITNTFAMAPWVARVFRDLPVLLRIYGYEILCPFYMSLWPKGKVGQWALSNPRAEICNRNYLTSPWACTACALRGIGRELLPRWMNPFSHEYVASGGWLPGYHKAVGKAFDVAHRILVSNEFTAGILHRWSSKVTVVPGGVDVGRFSPGRPSGEPCVLMPGRVEDPRKGYAVFREMVHRLVKRGVSLRAMVTDPRYDGNSPHIRSAGWVPYHDMPALLRSSRVVVVPTMWPEPFGLIALEAMASGVPVVVHRIGGLANLVEDGVSGLVVTPGDVESLADRVATLLNDDGLWLRMSQAARERALTFSWRTTVEAHYLSIFGMIPRSDA
ncbi:glycosyltransferase family 4 protein [Candidatus Fermentibacteria bacterium]|nr:glycosyltransferase family 4 protein [Candidatus Fermentibacteria bacterium]